MLQIKCQKDSSINTPYPNTKERNPTFSITSPDHRESLWIILKYEFTAVIAKIMPI
jgi:hypothetical protein